MGEDSRLREAGAEVVYCLTRGAPKGPNLPRARLNHQDALFPGHGLATHSQTSSSQPDLVLVQPMNGDQCALQALVSAVSHHPARRTAIVTADNSATGEVLRCDVIVDRVHSLNVTTTTRELLLDDSPEMMEVVAHNDQGDTFSSLDGVSFEWSILSEPSAGTQGAVWSESPYRSPPGVQFWEQRGLQGWAVLAQGVGTGSARIAVHLAHPDYKGVPGKQVTLLVVANVLLEPSRVFLLEGARKGTASGSHGPPLGQGCPTLRLSCKSIGHSRVYVSCRDGELDLESTTVLGCHKTLKAVHPAKTVVVAYGSFKDVAFEGGPRPWPMLEQGHYVKLVADNTSLVSIMRIIDPHRNNRDLHVFRILCKDLGETGLELRVGNSVSASLPDPARNQASVKFVCGPPSSVELHVKSPKGSRAASCPTEGDKVYVLSSQEVEVEVVVKDPLGRKLANVSSLDVHWELSDYSLATPSSHRDLLIHTDGSAGYRRVSRNFQVIRPKHKSGALTVTAKIVGYNHQILRHSSLPNVASVNLQDGSGSFQLECSDPAKAKVTRQIKVVLLGEGSVIVKVHDLCLDLPPLTLDVQLVGLARLHLHTLTKVELGQEMEAHVELEDPLGQSLPASVLNLVGLRPLVGAPLLEIRPGPGEGDRVRFAVRGSSLGTTSLQFVAGGPGANQVTSEALSVQVFAPLKLDSRNITLVVGATFQLGWSGGPQPEGQVEFSLEGNASVASVSTSGVVTASALGSVNVAARSLDSDSGVVYSQDVTSVHVVALTSIRIQPALSRMLSGTELPAFATGSNKFETPLSFCSAEPPLLFRWSVSDPCLLALEAPLVQEGLQPREENVCGVQLRALRTPGRVALRSRSPRTLQMPAATGQCTTGCPA
ncbi:nuclear pore membrane glycoprotein 210 [Ixodes scapularis]